MENVKKNALEGTIAPNNTDPLILQFRIMSENESIYDILVKYLNKYFKSYYVDAKYGFCGTRGKIGANVIRCDLRDLQNKVIIFIKGPPNDPTSYKRNKSMYEIANAGYGANLMFRSNYNATYEILIPKI